MNLLATIFPILALALAGYVAARRHFLTLRDCETLSRFTFNLVIPCLLFINTANSDIPQGVGMNFLLAYFSATLLLYLLAMIIGRVLYAYSRREQAVFGMGAAYSNTTIVGIPLVLQTLGPDALLPLFLIIALQNLVLFTFGTLAAEGDPDVSALLRTAGKLLKQLLSNPLTASLIAGLLFNLLEIPIWQPLHESVRLMSTAAIPLALFVLGTSLHQYRIAGEIGPALLMTVLKVMVLPCLVYLFAFHIFSINPAWATTAVLAACMPSGISAYVFAARYQACQATVAAGSLISTLVSLLPVLVVLALLP